MSIVDSSHNWFQNDDLILSEMRSGKIRTSSIPSLGAYDNLRLVGRGGQGDVFEAKHRDLGRRVAIKVLRRGAWRSESAERRFEREIELVAELQHANIVRIYEAGVTEDARRFYSMELISGVPLDAYMARAAAEGNPILQRDRLELFIRIADAVAFAHQNGIIHRDLKPGNILVDAHGEPHLLDFGLASWMTASTPLITMTGEFFGTLSYAAPEQVGAGIKSTDARTDVYALGVILYELLTGKPLVPTDLTLAEAVRVIADAAPALPSKASQVGTPGSAPMEIDADLDAITLKALAKRPEERYETAAALRDDVRRYLNHEPISARRPNSWYLLKRLARRHRVTATAAAIVLTTLFTSTAIMGVLYQRTATEAEKARQINVFLEDTLGSVSPASEGSPVALADVLDEAVHWVDIALENQPEVAASIRMTIGNSYRSLGAFDKAERELNEALAIRRDLHGETHVDAATSLNAIALLRRDQGRLTESDRLFRRVLTMRRQLLGDRDLSVAQTSQNLGILKMTQADWDEAAEYLATARAIRSETLGQDHPDTLMSRFQLGVLSVRTGDIDDAIRIHRSVLQSRHQRLHPNHPDIARSHRALGDLEMQHGDLDAAVDEYRHCYEIITRNLGCNHNQVTDAAQRLSAALAEAGDHEQAQSILTNHEDCVDDWANRD